MQYKILEDKILKKLLILFMVGSIALFLSACNLLPFSTTADNSKFEGEWYAPEAGYFVFNSDGTFKWYKDNTMSEDNVNVGTYEIIELDTYGGDKTYPGYLLTQEYVTINGEKQYFPTENNQNLTELAVYEHNGDSMTIKNLKTYNTYTVTKQK